MAIGMTAPGPSAFPPTRHSVIERIRTRDAEVRRDAYGAVVAGYWKPVYTCLRLTWQLSPEDAQDLTQGFFTEAFEKGWLEAYDPTRARFRTFVRVCADRYVMNWKQAAARLKRGGAAHHLSLDFPAAEREVHARAGLTSADPEELFRQEFVRSLFEQAVDAVRAGCAARGRVADFQLFERYDLEPRAGVSYAQLAREAGLTVPQVTNRLALVRREFRERALEALRALSGSDEHFRREAREVFGLEVE
jgi:DNA-directed RNA polymerase specialized sigma24 family protein